MTIAWLQVVGGAEVVGDFETGLEPCFSGVVDHRIFRVLHEVLESQLLAEYDGAKWLAQGGYEKVSIHVELRKVKAGRRQRRSVVAHGRLLNVEISCVCPEIETASLAETETLLRPVVLEALALAGERKNLGRLPAVREGVELPSIPLHPLIDDEVTPYEESAGDCFVVTRGLPPDGTEDVDAVFERYERDFEAIFSPDVEVVEIEATLTAVRWILRPAPATDEG